MKYAKVEDIFNLSEGPDPQEIKVHFTQESWGDTIPPQVVFDNVTYYLDRDRGMAGIRYYTKQPPKTAYWFPVQYDGLDAESGEIQSLTMQPEAVILSVTLDAVSHELRLHVLHNAESAKLTERKFLVLSPGDYVDLNKPPITIHAIATLRSNHRIYHVFEVLPREHTVETSPS